MKIKEKKRVTNGTKKNYRIERLTINSNNSKQRKVDTSILVCRLDKRMYTYIDFIECWWRYLGSTRNKNKWDVWSCSEDRRFI